MIFKMTPLISFPSKDKQLLPLLLRGRAHNRNNLSVKDTLQGPNVHFPILLNILEPLLMDTPYIGQNRKNLHIQQHRFNGRSQMENFISCLDNTF